MPENTVAQTAHMRRLCDHGKSYRSKELKHVMPGTERTCSQPRMRKMGQRMSLRSGAARSSASEVCGANFLAAKPTAKWPMNMVKNFTDVHRFEAKPNPKGSTAKIWTPPVERATSPENRLSRLCRRAAHLPRL